MAMSSGKKAALQLLSGSYVKRVTLTTGQGSEKLVLDIECTHHGIEIEAELEFASFRGQVELEVDVVKYLARTA